MLDLHDFSFGISIPISQSLTILSSLLACTPFDITPFPGVAISVKASAALFAEVTKRPEVTLSLFSFVLGRSHLLDNQLALLILLHLPLHRPFSPFLKIFRSIQLYGTYVFHNRKISLETILEALKFMNVDPA